MSVKRVTGWDGSDSYEMTVGNEYGDWPDRQPRRFPLTRWVLCVGMSQLAMIVGVTILLGDSVPLFTWRWVAWLALNFAGLELYRAAPHD